MEYTLIRSRRRTLSLSVTPEGILVRAPMRLSKKYIDEFVESRRDWIESHAARMEAKLRELSDIRPMTPEELQALREEAALIIPERVERFAPLVGVRYGKITIRAQRARWGSCSGSGSLSFNCLLMLAPPEVLDSVVVHELCHILEPNHSPRFYGHVLRVCPDYRRCDRWLKENGAALLRRVPAGSGK